MSQATSVNDSRAATRRGIFAMSLAMAAFVTNDSIVKFISESLPTAQLVFVRGLFAVLLLLLVARLTGALNFASLRGLGQPRVMLRAGFDATATLLYLSALPHLPLGNATAINMSTPLLITLFAVLFFKERVGLGRWLAVAIGFAGVLLIVQPAAAAFNAWTLLCLSGTVFHSARDLTTRYIPRQVDSVIITLATALLVTLFAGAWLLLQGWQAMVPKQYFLLAATSVFLSAGYYLIIVGMRDGEMSVIAPFRYTGLLFALLFGWLIWRDVPNALAWCGISLVVGAGLYVLHSERERTRAAMDAAPD